jgi:hypothetical protein
MEAESNQMGLLPGGVTDVQVKQWISRWGEVNQITVKLDQDGNKLTGYFKKPNLETISAASRFMESDPIHSGQIVFENCWLGGDEALKTNDEARFAALLQVNKLFRILETEVKKM